MIKKYNNYFLPVAILITAFFYIFDLGNIDGLRQGTEGLYLQVSKEMFQENSWITPLYRGERHWSKPPLHFMLPFPFYALGIFENIFSARLSIALLSIFLIYLASKWISHYFKTEKYSSFLFFCCTIGMIKYSRIFMMEIPLSLLTFCANLYFYKYFCEKSKSDLYLASCLLAASVLIKGPVSIIIAIFSICFYLGVRFLLYKKVQLKEVTLYAFIGLALGSIWFFVSYYNYGREFFDYFFLRENVGKFTAKSYPIRHVFQGLFLFSLPWSLYLPFAFKTLKHEFTHRDSNKFDILLFLVINFFWFFVIWMIPSQRSHHYAVPALPFFLTILYVSLTNVTAEAREHILYKIGSSLTVGIFIILSLVVSALAYYSGSFNSSPMFLAFMLFSVFVLLCSTAVFVKFKNVAFKALASLFFFSWIWSVLTPKFIPPQFPQAAIDLVGENQLYASVRKPYFIEEALGHSIKNIGLEEIKQRFNTDEGYFLLTEDKFNSLQIGDTAEIAHKWYIWRRRTRFKTIVKHLNSGDLEPIKTYYILFKKK